MAAQPIQKDKETKKEIKKEKEKEKEKGNDAIAVLALSTQQFAGVKRKVIYRAKNRSVRKWERRWVLHPNCRNDNAVAKPDRESEIWIHKWVTRDSDRSPMEPFENPEQFSYSKQFYQFDVLDNLPEEYVCDFETCGKIYYQMDKLRRHQREKHMNNSTSSNNQQGIRSY